MQRSPFGSPEFSMSSADDGKAAPSAELLVGPQDVVELETKALL